MTANPCVPKGHDCDGCRDCLKGRCCRKDNPGYRLPKMGEIQPYVGTLGVLADDGELAQCHVCGEWFGRVSTHARNQHDLLPSEYRAAFGLNAQTGLIGPKLRNWMSENGANHLAPYRDAGVGIKALRSITPEQRSQISSKRRTPEARRHLATAQDEYWSDKRVVVERSCGVCGAVFTADNADLRERKTCGQRACVRRLIALRGLKEVACIVCGKTWAQTSEFVRKTCSDECDSERRSRAARRAGVLRRPEMRARLLESVKHREITRDDKGRIVTWKRSVK